MEEIKLQSSLAKEIKKESDNLLKIVKAIPCKEYSRKVIEDKKSISDLIAYQIGWGNSLIRWYTDGVSNIIPDMPGEGFTTWDYKGLAELFYEKYSLDRSTSQLNEFQKTVASILKIVEEEHSNGNLDAIGVWSWCTLKSGKPWPLSKWIKVNTSAPYKRATSLIKKAFIS